MDRLIWREIAAFWVTIRSVEEKEKTIRTAEMLFQQAADSRQEERPLADLLKESINEEDDDDGY